MPFWEPEEVGLGAAKNELVLAGTEAATPAVPLAFDDGGTEPGER